MFRKVCISIAAFADFALASQPAAAVPPPTDFWLNKPFMNMAHQGGELEAPGNTLYAFKTAIKDRGADTLEMDGYLTADGKFVITHDLSPNPTSNISLTSLAGKTINQLTLAELKTLDFAYKFRPGTGHYGFPHNGAPASEYPFRGMSTGEVPPPAGYTADDFKIATLQEVLAAFPNTPLNVDMKAPGGNPAMSVTAATEVAKILANYPERSEDVIVASFYQPAMVAFHEQLPSWKALSVGEGGPSQPAPGLFDYSLTGKPMVPNPVALQPPDWIYLGDWLEPVKLINRWPDSSDYAIHVWPNDHDPEQDTPPYYRRQIEMGVDGLFTQVPSKLHEFLCSEGIPRPDGSPRCAQQVCPEGQTGIAPNDCKVLVDLAKPTVKPLKKRIKVGKKAKFQLKLTNRGVGPGTITVTVRSNNRKVTKPRSFKIEVEPRATVTREVGIQISRQVRSNAKVSIGINDGATTWNTTFLLKPKKKKNWWDDYKLKGEVKITASQNTQVL